MRPTQYELVFAISSIEDLHAEIGWAVTASPTLAVAIPARGDAVFLRYTKLAEKASFDECAQVEVLRSHVSGNGGVSMGDVVPGSTDPVIPDVAGR